MQVITPAPAHDADVRFQLALDTAGVAPPPYALPSPSCGSDAELAGVDIYALG
jgi:hypothetical protein